MPIEFENMYDHLIEDALLHEGARYAALYEQAYDVRIRLGARLHTDADDPDIVRLVELHEAMQKELCRIVASRISE